ncbi:RNA polymerase II transcription factor SIII subunit A-domain-containing protein [Lactifluus subvellereus]|nr:RNA polymerase II transcription factor SIII subunit A-domain-containing protein [Lactifluus subvellereus]
MSSEIEPPCRRIPSLVYYCRRVAAAHVGRIVSLGDNVSYELVRPILESCSADNLRRLEDATPHMRAHTNDLWRQQCFREHPAEVDEYSSGSLAPPKSWRDLFFDLRARKEKRLDEISARMKSQRLEAEERKKQKEIKFTDRVPPMKRARGWCATPQQKSLFQKTRSEASKIQRTMYEPRMRLPMPAVHTNRQRVQNVVSGSSSPSHPTPGTRVIVRPVPLRQPPTVPPASPLPEKKSTTHVHNGPFRPHGSQPLEPTAHLKQPSLNAKKEPACSLFMPKHRAHSQLTGRLVPPRASPTK